jgi:hypothetical protein
MHGSAVLAPNETTPPAKRPRWLTPVIVAIVVSLIIDTAVAFGIAIYFWTQAGAEAGVLVLIGAGVKQVWDIGLGTIFIRRQKAKYANAPAAQNAALAAEVA